MSTQTPFTNGPQLRERAKGNLGSLVIAIEFTLISVMVGVILFPLMDYATPILRELKFEYMPYVFSGLVLILYTWSIVITHSFTFVGWPMDLFHTLLYIVTAMLLAIQMHFLQDPQGWFSMTALSIILATLVGRYDKKIIIERLAHSTGAAAELYAATLKRQEFLVRVFPLSTLSALVQVALIYFFPTFFLQSKAHLILITIQIIVFSALTYGTLTTFQSARQQILNKAIQELANE